MGALMWKVKVLFMASGNFHKIVTLYLYSKGKQMQRQEECPGNCDFSLCQGCKECVYGEVVNSTEKTTVGGDAH